jgi:hypothetical protein
MTLAKKTLAKRTHLKPMQKKESANVRENRWRARLDEATAPALVERGDGRHDQANRHHHDDRPGAVVRTDIVIEVGRTIGGPGMGGSIVSATNASKSQSR